jgi:hypothetical protein
MSFPFHNPDRAVKTERASTPMWRGAAALWAVACLVAVVGSCTQVQVEDTHVTWEAATSCPAGVDGGQDAGGQPPGQVPSPAVMDTYVVQIFELINPGVAVASDCETCLATHANCFIEESSCVCGDQVPVSLDDLHERLGGVRVALPAKHSSLYCLRVMAVDRTSESESCACDSAWLTRDRVRLCALSQPYAASPLPPIEMKVQCDANENLFKACVGK